MKLKRKRTQRLVLILTAGLALTGAVALMLVALRDSVVYFYTPTELAQRHLPVEERARLGGLVVEGSVNYDQERTLHFDVTDHRNTISVIYPGEPTALFRESRSVIVEGVLDRHGLFQADLLLAKHDENYMPREIADSLKKAGQWYGKDMSMKEKETEKKLSPPHIKQEEHSNARHGEHWIKGS